MAEITQKLGFEAAGAIATLNSLNVAIKQVNTSMRAMNKAASASGGLTNSATAMANLDAQAKKAARGVTAVGTATQKAGKKGTSAAQSMTISWETFGRVLATQAIVRGLNAITTAIGDAAAAQAEFDLRTAQIANITDEGAKSFDSLQESISGLSVELGRPIGEVTEASMEALQNSLGTTAETMDLLKNSAHELALVTNSTLGQSINAISSVIKAYNLDISEAKDVSDIFFTAIDKGRITMSEFESRLGTVTPLANVLGIEFEDAAASIASLTLSGLNGSIAMTQFRNVLNKLVDPGKELQAAMESLGVTSGEELVEKFGTLQKALVALKGTVNGDEQALARMFETIRGKLGVLNLFANDGKNINDVLEAMQGRLNKVTEGADAIDATKTRQMQKATEELNESLRVLGDEFNTLKLGATIFANDVIRGLERIRNHVKPVTDAIIRLKNALVGEDATTVASRGVQKLADDRVRIQNLATDAIAQHQQQAADETFNAQRIRDPALKKFAQQEIETIKQAKIEQTKLREEELKIKSVREANLQVLKDAAEVARKTARVGEPGLLGPSPAEHKAQQQEAIATSEKLARLAEQIGTADAEGLAAAKAELEVENRKATTQFQNKELVGDEAEATKLQLIAVENLIQARQDELEVTAKIPEVVDKIKTSTEFLQQVIEKTAVDLGTKVPEAAKKVDQSIKEIKNPFVDTTQAVSAMRRLELAAIAAAEAVARANSAGGGANLAYHGGTPIYRAAGGPSRGQDTQPAMLAKGEHVTSARNSAKFAAQLQAMNAGQSPIFREQGGSVTNVGDVNVNVTGGSGSESPDVVGRQIANSLRRELRRKTSAL